MLSMHYEAAVRSSSTKQQNEGTLMRLTMLSARTIMLWAASVARRPCAEGVRMCE